MKYAHMEYHNVFVRGRSFTNPILYIEKSDELKSFGK